MNLLTCDPALVRATRERLWAEHLERPVDKVNGDSTRVIDELWNRSSWSSRSDGTEVRSGPTV